MAQYKRSMKKQWLQLLIMTCLVLANISPACKFISGKSLMEICFSDGSTAYTEMPEDLLAYLPNDTNNPSDTQDQNHIKKDDCAFCFTTSHFQQLNTAPIEWLNAYTQTTAHQTYEVTKRRLVRAIYNPRGPPAFFV